MSKAPSKGKQPENNNSNNGYSTQWRRPPSIWDTANIFSKLYCLYVFPFMYRNYQKDFDLNELSENSKDDDCVKLGERLKRHWNKELATKAKNGASFIRALTKTFGWTFLLINLISFFIFGILRSVMALILGQVINYSNRYFQEEISQNGTVVTGNGFFSNLTNRQNFIIFSAILTILAALNILLMHPFYMAQYRLGMRIRTATTRLVYEKALRVTNTAVQRFSVGKIVNLIANDVSKFDVCFTNVEFAYLAIPETVIAMGILYWYFGRASLGTLAIILFYIPFQSVMAKILSKFRNKSIVLTDDRLRLMSEILPSMKVIKMYNWERPFSAIVSLARKLEIFKIRQSMMLRCINLSLFYVSSKVMAFICIILYLLDGGELNAEIVFVSMSMFSQIRDNMTYRFPFGISVAIETYISTKRIEAFLLESEIDDEKVNEPPKMIQTIPDNPGISLKHVTVKSEIDGSTILKDVSFDVAPGQLTVIIGPVGAGKSSILLSILNEMPIHPPASQISTSGRLIYLSQEAWIFTGTIRDNIVFGRPYDPDRYRDVIKYSALAADLKQFELGDMTDVDDRGTSLSGGQRARISLARALYTDADIYLLDDPLSAVDAAVAKHIFEKCIKHYLRKKCVVLVTHQLQYVKAADQIVVLKAGQTVAVGSYEDLLKRGVDVFKYSAGEAKGADQEVAGISSDSSQLKPLVAKTSRHASFTSMSDTESISNFDNAQFQTALTTAFDAPDPSASDEVANYSTDTSGASRSSLRTLWIYIRAGAGPILFTTFLVSNFISQILFTGTDAWLSAWTDYQEQLHISLETPGYNVSKSPVISEAEDTNRWIYSGIILSLFIFASLRTITYFLICMRSSVNLHNRMFGCLIEAPIAFFDKTPIGVIMNRVSRDLNIIDDLLAQTGFDALEVLGNCAGIFVLCTALNYFVAVPFVFLGVLIIVGTRFYVNTARNVKRLEGVARSPLFNQMASTLNGLPTIRSYGTQKMFIDRFSDRQNLHSSAYFTFLSCSRLFGVYLEMICFVYIFCLILYMNLQLDSYNGSIIGLTISQSLMLTDGFNWGVRQYCEVENYMTAVERIVELGKLDREELEACQLEPEPSWPAIGDIDFDHVCLSYDQQQKADSDAKFDPQVNYVLKNLCFSIRGGEKVGIVGRTGAGKTSLITTLFRLTQPSGSIRIDGIDTSSISLSRLRKSLSIIPQEPILFSGNIRRNLDPFSEKTDEELWDAIEKVQLKAKIISLPAKLDSPVSECGADFSVGEKQLICLARAILRKNRILILDEATASIDNETDRFIQSTIRREFGHCTVLTIAHRLNTIIDYDRVMVLDAGQLVQFDKPARLIEAGEGIFFELFENLNADLKVELRAAAMKAAKMVDL